MKRKTLAAPVDFLTSPIRPMYFRYVASVTWIAVVFFNRQLLTLFRAEENQLPLAQRYLIPVKKEAVQ